MKNFFFCNKCHVILQPREENGNVYLECKNCGDKKEFEDWVEHVCSKCGFAKAIIDFHEFTGGDEGTTTMYRCIKCGYREREGHLA